MFDDIEDKEKYFIQPFIDGKYVKIEIVSSNGATSIKFFDRDDKRVKVENSIRKDLRKCYDSSKYKDYPIILKGFLVLDKKNRLSLVLYDILLKDEYEEKIQSKKYGLRFENLNIRFLNQKAKNVRSLFSHKFSDFNLDIFIKLFVQSLMTEKIVYRRNVPRNYCENETVIDDIWIDLNGEIVGAIKDEAIKKEFDEKQNLTTETPFDYLKSFNIKVSDEIIEVELLNFSENDRVEMLSKSDKFIGKKCIIKKYKILDKVGYIFVKCI